MRLTMDRRIRCVARFAREAVYYPKWSDNFACCRPLKEKMYDSIENIQTLDSAFYSEYLWRKNGKDCL